jgi:ATP synthase F1 gamma subunit
MSQVKEQKQHIQDIAAARYITGTLRDIALTELGGLQKRFAQNTQVYSELRGLFEVVWRIAEKRGIIGTKSTEARKRLYVAYTTNRHFYGALNHNIMRSFADSTGTEDECLIVGDTGKTIWFEEGKKRKHTSYLSFKDDVPTEREVYSFLERAAGYDQVLVCYPGFVNVYQQETRTVDITFKPAEEKVTNTDSGYGREFLLEPNVEDMLNFFNTQVRYALFERILLETQLSRVSARLVKMDTADQNADTLLKRERGMLRKSYTTIANRRMLETLVGYLQWHKNELHIGQ